MLHTLAICFPALAAERDDAGVTSARLVGIADSVTTVRAATSPHRQGTHATRFSREEISDLPAGNRTKASEALLERVPGVVPDEDGRMHVHGEDAQLQYVIDGIPVTANLTRVFSTSMPIDELESVSVLTGILPAEDGIASAAIIEGRMREFSEGTWSARISSGMGSLGERFLSGGSGANVGSTSLWLGGALAGSDRYLDPVGGFSPQHDRGNQRDVVAHLHAVLGTHWSLNVLGMGGIGDFEIPNASVGSMQDQRQSVDHGLLGASLLGGTETLTTWESAVWADLARATIRSGGLADIASAPDSLQALRENERFFFGGHRALGTLGFTTKVGLPWVLFGGEDLVQTGLRIEASPIAERFSFAVTDATESDSTQPGGDPRLLAYDLTRNGASPLRVDEKRWAWTQSAWLQNLAKWGTMRVSTGIRFDRFDLFGPEWFLSPRLSWTWDLSGNWSLRCGYNRIVMRQPYENVLVSSSEAVRAMVGADQGSIPTTVRPEKEHVLFGGAGWHRGNFAVDLDGYGKYVQDLLVKVELGGSGMIFPANLAEGLIGGGDLRATWNDRRNFLATLTISGCASMGHRPSDGSSPLSAGLVIGEEGRMYSHPWKGEDYFWTEHNQMLTATWSGIWKSPWRLDFLLGGRFDSGLPFDLFDPLTGSAPDADRAREILRQRGYAQEVIDLLDLEPEEPGSPDRFAAPRAIFDCGLAWHLPVSRVKADLRGEVGNVFDTPYLTRFEASGGGTHYGSRRTFSTRLDLAI